MTGQEGVVVRPAEAGDLPLLGPLEVAAGRRFAEVGLASVAGDEPPSLAAYAEAHDRGHLWVATVPSTDAAVGHELVGYVWVLDLDGQHHLEQISVRAEHGGKGIGVALMEQAVAWARTQRVQNGGLGPHMCTRG